MDKSKLKWLAVVLFLILALVLMVWYTGVGVKFDDGDSFEISRSDNVPQVSPTPYWTGISIEQAIQDYYSLIRREQYEVAWQMLSAEFISFKGLTFDEYESEWKKSGSATIVEPLEVSQSNDRATVTLVLDYSNSKVRYKIQYEFRRDPHRGNERFGYWLFVHSTVLNYWYP